MYLIAVEGNIGCGKTTILEKIKKKSYGCVVVIPESLLEWENICCGNLIQLMYEDPKRWMFTLQMNIMLSFKKNLELYKNQDVVVVMERSVFTGLNIFGKNALQKGILTCMEYHILKTLYNEIVDWTVDKYVYIHSESVDNNLKNIMCRGRLYERKIDKKFLSDLEDMYKETFMVNALEIFDEEKVSVIMGNEREKDALEIIDKIIKKTNVYTNFMLK